MTDITATFILADNQDITRAGLRMLISDAFPSGRIVEKRDKHELIQFLRQTGDCVVIIDYALFSFNGVENLLNVIARFESAHWVIFSSELTDRLIRRLAIEKNVNLILKENSGEEIMTAIRMALRHEHYVSREISAHVTTPCRTEKSLPLTESEREILRLIGRGMSVKEISCERNSSVHTITTHKKNIFRKIGVNCAYEAVRYALRSGLVDLSEYTI
ncbi:response regulator transcription factor [uncultured Muribaculum sp.]|uniref:response regulator transcription factor n=1 Tax=uncultured Muribaculum sp. TaxID=1918613 RepID=UPI0025E43476|nr:response regulator transcription factor [uncultured Muribaculum sp.]